MSQNAALRFSASLIAALAILYCRTTASAAGLTSGTESAPDTAVRANPNERIKAFCIDFNWGSGGPNGFPVPGTFAHADPAVHYQWYRSLGVNVIQTFCVSCNGYAWYQGSEVAPVQPGLRHDFLRQITELAHQDGVKVMGYFCVGANTYWGQTHPEQSYGIPSGIHIPFTNDYLDYLEGCIKDALTRTGIDGFMIDWAFSPPLLLEEKNVRWLPCEQTMYEELFEQPFPGKDRVNARETLEFQRRALERCWQRIQKAARSTKPDCIIWLSCFDLAHPQVVGTAMLREVDWVMNETPTPEKLDATRQVVGPHARLIQCVSGGSTDYDASRVLDNAKYQDVGLYGFAPWPDPNTTLPPDPPRDVTQKNIQANIAKLRQVYLASASSAKLTNLRCEYLANPLGIDVEKPRLSWVIESRQRGERQTAYQVIVASTPELLAQDQGDLWDSGKVASDQSIHVDYAGQPLRSLTRCHWKVRVWDRDGRASAWSHPARWTMGLLDPKDWQAAWIKPGAATPRKHDLDHCSWIWFPQTGPLDQTPPGTTYFRVPLRLPPNASLRRASVVMCADNAFVLFVNAKEALKGDDWHSPARAELTEWFQAGENILTVAATNSDIGPNAAGLVGRVTVELSDGRQLTLETGPAWKSHDQEQTGWREGGFDDTSWPAAQVVAKFGAAPWGQLSSQENAPASWVRKVFTLAAAPESGVASVNVMGYYELYVNGQKVSDDVLSPAVSDHTRRSLYLTYDIRSLLRPGPNCVGLWLDSGWYRPGPVARVQLDLSVGGHPVRVGTDRTWTCAPSTHTLLGGWKWGDMGGERIDARCEIAGWNEVECTAGEWIPVAEVPPPKGTVVAQSCPPNRIGAVLPLAACTALGAHTWELDFGTNLTGWLRLRLPRMKAGQQVVMHYADKRFQTPGGDDTPAGRIKPSSQRTFNTPRGPVSYQTFNQVDEFISAGQPGEQFCSRFNYHGFRYVIVEGLSAQPAPGDAEALLIESNLEPAGEFACSNDLFNRIHQVNLWTLRCLDLGGYLVDCPHRERLGYGDGQVGIESLTMNRNAAAFYGKWTADWLEAQNPATGEIPYTAPKYCDSGGGPGWGGAGCVLPWKLYLYYGNRRLLERAYEPMRRYLEFIEGKCTNGVLRRYGGDWDFIGDWVPPGRGMDTSNWPPKPAAELFNNGYRLYLWDLRARAAAALGRPEDAQRCRAMIREIRPLVHAAFYDASNQLYLLDEQACQLMPLMTGVVPEDLRGTIQQKLADGIRVKRQGHLDTGMLGTYFLIQYLQETGRSDLLYSIFSQTTYPGWGYMLSQGATTFWEQWNGYWSQIHSCFTSPGGWFYQGLAGIRADETAPGFKKVLIKPAIVGDLTWVKAHYESVHGRIVSGWRREGDTLSMDVTIPANTTATVFVPANDTAEVTESGGPAKGARGVTFLRSENRAAVYGVVSGTYRFQSTLPGTVK